MSDSIETKGKTVDLAVSEALLQLGLRRDEVEIKVLEEPRAGLMGFLGARQAKVLVSKRRSTRGGRSGGRDRRRDEDHRAHDLTADGSSGRGRGRGGRDDSRGGRDSGRGGRDRNGGRGGRDDNRDNRDARGGRGGRDEVRSESRDPQPARPRVAPEGRTEGPREDLAEGQRSRRRRGGRGRGGRGRSAGQGDAPREGQPNGNANVEVNGNVNGNVAAPAERSPRREGGDRGDRGGRGVRGGRGGRGDRPERDREEVRLDAVDEAPRHTAPTVERPREAAVPRERAREERSRRDQHPAAVAATAADNQPNAAMPEGETVTPEVIETAVIANATPKAKPKAWGGLGARRERPPVTKPLVRVNEPSPATIGSVFKPSRKAVARAAAAAAAADRPAPTTAPRVGAIDAPREGGYTSSGSRHSGDEAIATGIAATDYAKPMAPVDADGQPGLLTELTTGMLARAGFPCECETLPGEYHAVKVSADEDSAGMLIGRGGSTAEAIEHLVERMASNAAGDRVRMNLDINDYRIGREDSLRQHTLDAVAEVRASGKPYHMEPMDARERRVVHLEVEAMPDLTTYTVIGSGGKHVVIAMNDGSQPDEGADD